jgi:hypothetical protein
MDDSWEPNEAKHSPCTLVWWLRIPSHSSVHWVTVWEPSEANLFLYARMVAFANITLKRPRGDSKELRLQAPPTEHFPVDFLQHSSLTPKGHRWRRQPIDLFIGISILIDALKFPNLVGPHLAGRATHAYRDD